VIASIEPTERLESARDRASAASHPSDPDGRLNDRARSLAWLAAAVMDWTGLEAATVRPSLIDLRARFS
jgi:hypothetical protein